MRNAAFALILCLLGIHAAPVMAQSPEDIQRIEAALPGAAQVKPKVPRKLLIFTLAKGFVHSSIPVAAKALEMLGQKTGAWESVISNDPAMFSQESLVRFDAISFVSTTGTLFTEPEYKQNLLDFVRSGKGITGFHAATDCFYDWPEFGSLMGGYFNGHPWHEQVAVKLNEPEHVLLRAFNGKPFTITDEIYQFRDPYSRLNVRELLSLDTDNTNMQKGGINRTDGDFAVSWVRRFGKGRVFYSSLGHREEIWWNPAILSYYLDGIQFAMGDLNAPTAPATETDPASADPYMGEYAGQLKLRDGSVVRAEAKVVSYGRGTYLLAMQHSSATATLPQRIELHIGSSGGGGSLNLFQDADGKVPGITYSYYEGDWNKLPDFGPLTPAKTGTMTNIELKPRSRDDGFAFQYRGFLAVDEDGTYEFSTESDDGSALYVGDKKVVDNDGPHGMETRKGKIHLTKGRHPITVAFFEAGGGEDLKVGMARVGDTPAAADKNTLTIADTAADSKWSGTLTVDSLTVTSEAGDAYTLKRQHRVSPTLGAKPPAGAAVLLPCDDDGRPSLIGWQNTDWLPLGDGSMQVTKGNNISKQEFGDQVLHLEFMTPYMPEARGQGRGNSGVYLQNRYEVQVLDSFGLVSQDNDCGSIYKVAVTRHNACLPPLHWQTYDITFRAARMAADGTVAENPRVTVIHNGIVIHQNQELPGATASAGTEGTSAKGPLHLQDHGNPVRYRNIWIVEKPVNSLD